MKRSGVWPFAALCCLVAFCGGETLEVDQPPGDVEPDGNFVGADGGPVYEKGGACSVYDPASFSPSAFVADCADRSDCIAGAAARVPAGYPEFVYCASGCRVSLPDVNNHQVFAVDNTLYVHCTPGDTGDAFCSEYFNQFVLGSGSTVARCIQGPAFAACAADRTCWDTHSPDASCEDGLELCVSRNGNYGCEPPCTAPPQTGGDP